MKNLIVVIWMLMASACFGQSIKRSGFTTNEAGAVIDAGGSVVTNLGDVVVTGTLISSNLQILATPSAGFVLTDVAEDGIATWAAAPGSSGGEANTTSNQGTGVGIASAKSLVETFVASGISLSRS